MITHEIPELDARGLRQFALVTGTIVSLLFGLFLPWLFGLDWPIWPWIISTVLIVWGLVAPASLRPIYRGWMRFGLLLSRITTPLILGILFFLLFAPIATIMRLAGRDPMKRTFAPDQPSYREISNPAPPKSMERPF